MLIEIKLLLKEQIHIALYMEMHWLLLQVLLKIRLFALILPLPPSIIPILDKLVPPQSPYSLIKHLQTLFL